MNYWCSDKGKEAVSPLAVKLVRDIKLRYSVLSDLMENDEKRLFYLFNYVPRLLGKALCLTSMNFENHKMNKAGVDYMLKNIKYIIDKLGPILKLSQRKVFIDYTFLSSEGGNSIEKAITFYEIMLLNEQQMLAKLTKEKNNLSTEDASWIMSMETEERKPIPEETQTEYKKSIFVSK